MRTNYNIMSRRPLVLAGSLLASVPGMAPAVAQEPSRYYGPHMWDGGWWMFLGPVWMILVLVAVIAGVVLLLRWLSPMGQSGTGGSATRTPLDILRERFARGEIDKQEFEERRRTLGD